MGGSKGGATQAKLPTPGELGPLLELQSKYNRVGVSTPFGAQNYSRNPDGSYNLNTTVSPGMQAMIDRVGGLAMTDSARMQGSPQVDAISGALAGRVGDRLGLSLGNAPMQGVQQPQSPPAKP